jgi:hypothetical protein
MPQTLQPIARSLWEPPHWAGELLVLYYDYQSPELPDWLDRHCPGFDRAVLGEREPRAGVLFTRS